MSYIKNVSMIVVMFFVLSGCKYGKERSASAYVPNVVTEDIKAGIEKYIEDQSSLNNGYFKLTFEKKILNLKLVRVHVEYLASLGPRLHFACVDLADTDGEVYDVDFFMKGEPGAMSVTETSVHKMNGKPFYAWEQQKDKTWKRVPIEEADATLLGVIEGSDRFDFYYRAELPEITGSARIWIPIAVSDQFQKIKLKSIKAPGKQKFLNEAEHGNKILYLEIKPEDSRKKIEIIYKVDRVEKSAYIDKQADPSKYLASDKLVPVDDYFKGIADEVLEGKKGELVRARALYDHVIDRISYKKVGDGYGKGDAVYACDSQYGNCTDFHSYFIALARSAKIPARFAIGAAIPSSRDEGGISGYHCWAEFYAEGKWWPVDISEADKYTNLATYYFGHHPANRIEFSRGRDLVIKPGPAPGSVNFFAYPILEMADEQVILKPKFSFERTQI